MSRKWVLVSFSWNFVTVQVKHLKKWNSLWRECFVQGTNASMVQGFFRGSAADWNWVLYHDNAPCHTEMTMSFWLVKTSLWPAKHLIHLITSSLWLLVKNELKGCNFCTIDNIKSAVIDKKGYPGNWVPALLRRVVKPHPGLYQCPREQLRWRVHWNLKYVTEII